MLDEIPWILSNSGLANNTKIFALAIDPINPHKVYAGTSVGIHMSTNGGESWKPSLANNATCHALLIHPTIPQTVYAGTTAGIFISTNGGESWGSINAKMPKAITSLAIGEDSFSRELLLVAGVSGEYPVICIISDPRLWMRHERPAINVTSVAIGKGGRIFYGMARASVKFSPEHAEMIQKLQPMVAARGAIENLPTGAVHETVEWRDGQNMRGFAFNRNKTSYGLEDYNVLTLAIDPKDAQVVYAGTSQGVFKRVSDDEDWQASGLSNAVVNVLIIDSQKPQTLYAGTNNGIFKSVDGGGHWDSYGLSNAAVYAITLDQGRSQALYAGTMNGIYKLFIDQITVNKPKQGGITMTADDPKRTEVKPLIELDPQGNPMILKYDMPEPISYRGRHVIELDFPIEYFEEDSTKGSENADTQAAQHNQQNDGASSQDGDPEPNPSGIIYSSNVSAIVSERENLPDIIDSSPSSEENQIENLLSPRWKHHGFGHPGEDILGSDVPEGRRVNEKSNSKELEKDLKEALKKAKDYGYFDPKYFPNMRGSYDNASLTNLKKALVDLEENYFVTQFEAGNRLTIYRTATGQYFYRFVPQQRIGVPSILLVEYYRLSTYPHQYGAGRTLKTFSLLPGEKTSISISTYKDNEETAKRAYSIVDSTSDDTEIDFERTALHEQSSKGNISKSFEYHAEAEAEAQGSWGWGSASVDASGGVKSDSNDAREEFGKNLANAVAHNAARASSRREMHIDTNLEVRIKEEERQAITRELENINVSRTLNFVFRQMNQKFLTFLHLVDIRVAFFNGFRESRYEVPITELEHLLDRYIRKEKRTAVFEAIKSELQSIQDFKGNKATDFVQVHSEKKDGAENSNKSDKVLNHETLKINYKKTTKSDEGIEVPGVIIAANSHIMRTDGVIVDSFLGQGEGLDNYSHDLQIEAIRKERLDNDKRELEGEIRRFALDIVKENNPEKAALFLKLFPNQSMPPNIKEIKISNAVENDE